MVHKMDFTDILDLFTAARTRKKTVLSVLLKDLQFWITFSLCTKNYFAVQFEKYSFSNFCDFCNFKSHMNRKLRFQVLGAPIISLVRQGHNVVLIWHSLGFPQVLNPPPSTSPLPCSEDHLPLSD